MLADNSFLPNSAENFEESMFLSTNIVNLRRSVIFSDFYYRTKLWLHNRLWLTFQGLILLWFNLSLTLYSLTANACHGYALSLS